MDAFSHLEERIFFNLFLLDLRLYLHHKLILNFFNSLGRTQVCIIYLRFLLNFLSMPKKCIVYPANCFHNLPADLLPAC